jgi:hypothetical protein
MPILVMALLALILFGTIGILLVVAVIMERSPREHPARSHRSPVSFRFRSTAQEEASWLPRK